MNQMRLIYRQQIKKRCAKRVSRYSCDVLHAEPVCKVQWRTTSLVSKEKVQICLIAHKNWLTKNNSILKNGKIV